MNRRKRRIGIGLFLLLILLTGGFGLWLHGQPRQHALNRQLINALVDDNDKLALALINDGADPNTRLKPTPVTSLLERVKQFLHLSPSPVNDSPTAFLIVCGVKPDDDDSLIQGQANRSEDAPLVQAMLQQGAEVNAKDPYGWTALLDAALAHRWNTVGVLVQHGADVNVKDNHGKTPLMLAAISDDPKMVRLLLEHGADVNAKDKFGQTPLTFAVLNDKSDVVRLLLEQGADANAKEKDGWTPLMLAHGRLDTIALLHQYGAK